MFSGGTNWQY